MIRPATPADADALAWLRFEFRAALGEVTEDADGFRGRCAAWMRAALGDAGSWRGWLAEAAEGPVGMAWLQLVEKLPNPVGEPERHGYVSSLYVRSQHRGRGLGGRLLAACIETGRDAGCDALFLWPTPRSRSLYARHGFAPGADLWIRDARGPRTGQAS